MISEHIPCASPNPALGGTASLKVIIDQLPPIPETRPDILQKDVSLKPKVIDYMRMNMLRITLPRRKSFINSIMVRREARRSVRVCPIQH